MLIAISQRPNMLNQTTKDFNYSKSKTQNNKKIISTTKSYSNVMQLLVSHLYYQFPNTVDISSYNATTTLMSVMHHAQRRFNFTQQVSLMAKVCGLSNKLLELTRSAVAGKCHAEPLHTLAPVIAASFLRCVANSHVHLAVGAPIAWQAEALVAVWNILTRPVVLARIRDAFVKIFFAVES